jgi:hypothetical protein
LLHPHWACDLYEESAVTNFFGLGVARDGFADDLVPNRPDAVFVKPWRQVEPLQGLIENLPDTLQLWVFLSHIRRREDFSRCRPKTPVGLIDRLGFP